MKKSIQDEIDALKAETAAAYAAIAALFSPESCMENMSMTHSFHADMPLVTRRGRMPHSIKKQ